MRLRYYGDPILRRWTVEVTTEELRSQKFQQFLRDLEETMVVEDGVGLAAPQVGSSKRVCVASDGERAHVLVNPRIRGRSVRMETDVEGCLSLPGLQADVPRHSRVIVEALTPAGEKIEIRAKGFFARVLQHEIDHLDGVLYVDRADLSTLVWLKKVGEDQVRKIPTTLEEVKRTYAHEYHLNRPVEALTFDPTPRFAEKVSE